PILPVHNSHNSTPGPAHPKPEASNIGLENGSAVFRKHFEDIFRSWRRPEFNNAGRSFPGPQLNFLHTHRDGARTRRRRRLRYVAQPVLGCQFTGRLFPVCKKLKCAGLPGAAGCGLPSCAALLIVTSELWPMAVADSTLAKLNEPARTAHTRHL